MAEADGRTSPRLDRVHKPDPRRIPDRDAAGKEALYSTAPGAMPSAQVLIWCRRCDVETGVSVLGLLRTLRPPLVLSPFSRQLWARCPTCERRAWLQIRKGQALRAWLDRPRMPPGE